MVWLAILDQVFTYAHSFANYPTDLRLSKLGRSHLIMQLLGIFLLAKHHVLILHIFYGFDKSYLIHTIRILATSYPAGL